MECNVYKPSRDLAIHFASHSHLSYTCILKVSLALMANIFLKMLYHLLLRCSLWLWSDLGQGRSITWWITYRVLFSSHSLFCMPLWCALQWLFLVCLFWHFIISKPRNFIFHPSISGFYLKFQVNLERQLARWRKQLWSAQFILACPFRVILACCFGI